MNKKAQVTTFVILGIVIVAVIVLGLYLKDTLTKTAAEKETAIMASLPEDIAEIREAIAECSQSIFEEALVVIGEYGGYNSPLVNSLEVDDIFVTYGYFEGEKALPSLEAIKAEISEYIEAFLPDCADFSLYEGFEITAVDPKVEVDMLKDSVEAEIEYKVNVKKEGSSFKLDQPYIVEAQVKLLNIHGAASKIVDQSAKNDEIVDVGFLLELDFDVDVVPIDEKTVAYSIEDKDSKLIGLEGETSFVYIFASKAE